MCQRKPRLRVRLRCVGVDIHTLRMAEYARNQHRDRTCLRCSQTYQNCSNHSSACQNTRWHTENTEATMRGECGHTYRIRVRAQHASVTCSVQNSAGDTCTGGSYYVCQSHTHIYPSRSTPTPTPSPPENSNPNNNEDEEEEEEEEVPAAPPAPVISYHPCGIHLTTVSGDHSLQASCSTDRTCIATSFYRCQHSSHTYPAPPPAPAPTPTPTVVCPADSWTNCGGTSSHAQTCRSGHTYYTCGTAEAHHKDRTCTRCSETYTKCSHTATSCGGTRWHTQLSRIRIFGVRVVISIRGRKPIVTRRFMRVNVRGVRRAFDALSEWSGEVCASRTDRGSRIGFRDVSQRLGETRLSLGAISIRNPPVRGMPKGSPSPLFYISRKPTTCSPLENCSYLFFSSVVYRHFS